ncbi:MAG: hypothetical protein HQL83_00300 [Magnetococcales bacterium]|nr:hypothetical protein [Magnetococcales bacterium]
MTTTYGHLSQVLNDYLNNLKNVEGYFPFKATEYYLSLIDWSDPSDPLRRIVIPSQGELAPWGVADPSREHRYTVLPGLEHKYPTTALLLVSDTCASICRYCFRKRIFQREVKEKISDLDAVMAYLRSHQEITNVLLPPQSRSVVDG